MPRGVRSKTSKAKVVRADEMSQALDLKREGKTIREIAAILGFSKSKAQNLIEEGIASIPVASRDALVAEIHERELGIIDKHWPMRVDPDSAKVIQASHKNLMALLGLEAPKKTELTGANGGPVTVDASAHDDVLRSLAALASAAAVGSGDPKPDA